MKKVRKNGACYITTATYPKIAKQTRKKKKGKIDQKVTRVRTSRKREKP